MTIDRARYELLAAPFRTLMARQQRGLEWQNRAATIKLRAERKAGELLAAALTVRSQVGRLNDVIHACTIALALPHILEPGEQIAVRPSLGAGNDASRPFDLETDRRVAEFKVAQWKGKDTMRKRTLVSDLVHWSTWPSTTRGAAPSSTWLGPGRPGSCRPREPR